MKVTEAAVKSILRKWRSVLGLGKPWHITVEYFRDDGEVPADMKDCTAAVHVKSGYSVAELQINVPAIERDADSLETIILHELVHIILDPLRVIAKDALHGQDTLSESIVDTVTETITRALLCPRK